MKFVMVILLVSWTGDFTTDSPIYSFNLKVKECDESHIVTKYYEDMNKHLLVKDGKKWQYIGYICKKIKYSVYN